MTNSTQTTQNIELRNYQQQAISAVYEAWHRNPRVLLSLPTGAGKTVLFSAISAEFAKRGETVLILVHRQELLNQAVDKLRKVTDLPIGVIKSGVTPNRQAPIQVCSVQSLQTRYAALEMPGLVVIDEGHHACAKSYQRILDAYQGAYFLGVTATPTRSDGKGFEGVFDELIEGVSTADLIAEGYLSPFKMFGAVEAMLTGRIARGDFVPSEISKKNPVTKLAGDLIANYERCAQGKRNLIFAITCEHSKEIARRFAEAGYKSAHLDGDSDPEERQEVLSKFASGEILVLSNCSLFAEGYDLPQLDCVQIARPTQSLALYMQMCGRVLRPAPNKDFGLILDHGGNWMRFGLPSRKRVFTLAGLQESERQRVQRNKQTGEIETRQIIEDTAFDLKELEQDFDRAIADFYAEGSNPQLSEADQIWQELLQKQRSRGYKDGWLYHQLFDIRASHEVWQKYAKHKGYKPGWAWHQYQQSNFVY